MFTLNIVNEYDKNYINSPSLHQNFYQKFIKCLSKNISFFIIPNILNEEDIDIVIEEIVNDKDFQKPDTEIQTYESIEELNFPQEYDNGGVIILDDLFEKEMNESRHNYSSIFNISQHCYELPKITIRAKGKIYHIFEPNNFRDVLNICQDKSSRKMIVNKFKILTSSCWTKKYQSTIYK